MIGIFSKWKYDYDNNSNDYNNRIPAFNI